MRFLRYFLTAILLLFLAHAESARAQVGSTETEGVQSGAVDKRQLLQSDNGVRFLENRGQVTDTRGDVRPDILYTVSSPNTTLYFFRDRISYVFAKWEGDPFTDHCNHDGDGSDGGHDHRLTLHRVDMELVGSRRDVRVDADEVDGFYANYYLEHCPDGITHVRSFRRVVYHDIYPNIDMVLHGDESGVKCDFIVRPGGRVADIRMQYVDGDETRIDKDGELRVTTPLGWIEEAAPVTYQEVGGHRETVGSRFVYHDGIVGFEVDPYNPAVTLVIDPQRKWSTYYGGSNVDNLNGGDPTEVDRGGNVLFTGWTRSNPFPTTSGNSQYTQTFGGGNFFGDAFVVKFNGGGTRLWATYYGGNSDEIAHGISSDVNKNVFITGHTDGTVPTSSGAYQTGSSGNRDAFVVKFDSNGVRIWGTMYGGSNFDDGYGFGVDSTGNVAVLVTSTSSGLQTTGMTAKPGPTSGNGSYDVLLVKFSPAGSRLWATYIGGNGTEYGYAAASDIDDNIIFTGWTNSTNFPVSSGAAQTSLGGSYDAFLVKFNSSGTMQWSTYYGGTGTEGDDASVVGYAGIATDGDKNIFIAGHTSGGFPTTTGAFQTTYGGGSRDAFIVKFSPTGALRWSTYFGGSSEDVGVGCASSGVGSVLATGFTTSNNLPVTTDAYQAALAGNEDVFIVKLDSLGAREYVSYYGGSSNDEGHGISFDPSGAVAVCGNTQSTNFPTLQPYQSALAGQWDAFAVVFCDASPPKIDSTGPLTFCYGDSVTLFTRLGYYSYFWNTGNFTHSIKVKESGKYWLRITSAGGCVAYSDTIEVKVLPRPDPEIIPGRLIKLCEGDSVTLDVGPKLFLQYKWNTGATTRKIRVGAAGSYYVIVVDSAGCADTSEVTTVIVNPRPPAAVVTIAPRNPSAFCEGDSVKLTATAPAGSRLLWSTGERTTSIWARNNGYYRVSIVNEFDCPALTGSDSVYVTVYPRPIPQIIPLGPTTFCEGDSVKLTASSGYVSYRWSTGDTARTIVARTAGRYELTVVDDKGCVGTSYVDVLITTAPKVKLLVKGSKTICEGDSVTLDPGEGYLWYKWSTGDSTPTLVVKESGKYSVTLGDAFGCNGKSDTVQITVIPRPVVEINGPEVVCANTTADYSVQGESGAKYVWTVTGAGGKIVSGDGTNSITVQWGASGTGKVKVTVTNNTTGCSATDELTVTISNTLVPRITARPSTLACEGDSVTLDAGSYDTWLWSTGETTQKITVKASGSYWVSVTKGTCSGKSNTVTVTFNKAPQPVLRADKLELCPGEVTVIRLTEAYSKYKWSTGETTSMKSVSTPGIYSCTVTTASGCTGTATIEIKAAEAPKPLISGPITMCPNGDGEYTVVDATVGSSYKWTVSGAGGMILSGQNTKAIRIRWSVVGTGTVIVEETSANGCKGSSDPLVVTVASTVVPKITADGSTVICLGDSVRLNAPEGFLSYSWSTGETETSIVAHTAGYYRVTVTDENGCTGTDSIEVVVRSLPFPFISPQGPIDLCEGDSVELKAAGGYISYIWSNGETTQSIVVKTAGKYNVTAVDEDGCRGSSEDIEVRVSPLPVVPVVTMKEDTLTVPDIYATYQWHFNGSVIPGATTSRVIANLPGNYNVVVTNAAGCSATSEPADYRGATARIELGDYQAVPGQRLSIPITMTASRNLDQLGVDEYTAVIRFNSNLLYPVGETPFGIDDKTWRIITYTGKRNGLETGNIGTLEFIAALGDTLFTPVAIDSFAWSGANIAVSWKDGSVTIMPQGGWKLYLPEGRFSLAVPKPNPAVGMMEVTYETIESGRTQLYIVDMLGRRVTTILDAEVTADKYTLRVDASGLASGSYFLVLQTPTGRALRTLQVEH